MVRARVGDAEVVSSSVKPPASPKVLVLPFKPPPPEADELELDDVDPALPLPASVDDEATVLILRFEAIFRSPGAVVLAGKDGNPAVPTPNGLRRWGVDLVLAGDRGGLNGAESVLGAFLVVTWPELLPACLMAAVCIWRNCSCCCCCCN